MKCPNCQFENPDGMKFCGECGCEIKSVCPQCHFANPPKFKFCGECGARLSAQEKSQPKELSLEDKLDKLQRYLPKGVTEKILAQRGRIEGERKHITVLFCDLVGFTPMVEKLGHEDAYSLMDQVYEILIHKVHEYGGTVNEMTGDGVMALFGAPIALEDAPQRAIRSAIAIHRGITLLSNEMADKGNNTPSLKMRIGINTGYVVVGTLGNDLRVEFKAVGDTVNLASRMEGLAEPGTTYVTENTFKHAEGFFRFESVGQKQVKGIKEPVKVYRVLAASTLRTRFDVSAERGLTPLLGREREIGMLLDAFQRAKACRGQAVSIVSEAGMGKSRLLYEFRKLVTNENITLLEGQCTSFTKGIAYYPIKDILRANFDILEGDDDAVVRGKVRKGLKLLDAEEKDTLPYLLELLAVQDSGIEQGALSPDGLRTQVMEALTRIVLKGSEVKPLIMAFEDLHWMDKSSEETIQFLLECIPGSRVLLLFTFRPEYKQPWETRSYHNQLMLDRLSMLECIRMATQLLGAESLDDSLERLIHTKTEGVPFFIEEFIRSLQNMGILKVKKGIGGIASDTDNTSVPSTIQDVIMSRVDRLPERAKNLLQTGSAIEREFSLEMIKTVTGLPAEDIISDLSYAKDAELIYERGVYPQTTYIFKHALTRDVIYKSILTNRKIILHGKIANTIETILAGNLEEAYSVLAEHYLLNENFDKVLKYARLAAKKALKTASIRDGIYFTKKCIFALEQMPPSDEIELKLIDTRTILALYQIQLNYFAEAKESIEPIIPTAQKANYKKRLAQIYIISGAYESCITENYDAATAQLELGLALSEEISDVISLVLGNNWMGWNACWICEFEHAYKHFRKTFEINELFGNRWGIAALKSSIGLAYYWNGRIDSAYVACREAIELADKSGDSYSKAMAYTNYGVACWGKRYLEEALEHLKIGTEYCKQLRYHLWHAMGQFNLGEIHLEMGALDKSEQHYEKALMISEKQTDHLSFLYLCQVGFQRVRAKRMPGPVNMELFQRQKERNNANLLEGWIYRYIGEILLSSDGKNLSEAANWIEKAIEADRKHEMQLNLGKDYALYADLFDRMDDRSKTLAMLNQAKEVFSQCGADGWVDYTDDKIKPLS
jgi:class 3 adenylate cyclase/tetratricopeptide (TPR) repeat protein